MTTIIASNPGKETVGELSLTELLAIDTLRRLENGEPHFVPSVDIPLATSLASQENRNPNAKSKVLADRADSILQKEYGFGKSLIAEALNWLRLILFAFVVIVVIGALGICGGVILLRGADQTVSVSNFVFFLAAVIISAVPPLLIMFASLMQRPQQGKSEAGSMSFIAKILEDLVKFPSLIYWVLHVGMSKFQKHMKGKFVENSMPQKIERSVKAMEVLATGHSQLLLKTVAMTSHLCWTIVCIIVFWSIVFMTNFKDQYDFRWSTTYQDKSSQREAISWLKFVAAPLVKLSLAPVPDENLVDYLLSSSIPQKVSKSFLAPLNKQLIDLVRFAEESQERVYRNRFPEEGGKGNETLRQEGITAAREYLHSLVSLTAAIRDDTNAMQLLGNPGQEMLKELDRHFRELKLSAVERKVAPEELVFEVAKDDRGAKQKSAISRINTDLLEISYLLNEINRKQNVLIQENELRNNARSNCAYLMRSFLMYYGILPRLILFIIACFQLYFSVRGLRPSLTSPYFAKIIANLDKPPMGPSTDIAGPTEPRLSTESGNAAPYNSIQKVTSESPPSPSVNPVPTPVALHSSATVHSPLNKPPSPKPQFAAIFGYEVSPPDQGWDHVVPVSKFGEALDLGNADDPDSRKHILDKLCPDTSKLSILTIVVDLNRSPDQRCVDFLKQVIEPWKTDAVSKIVVLLSCGEQMRRRFQNNINSIRDRVQLWKQRLIEECGVQQGHVFEFDHEVDTPESRKQLLERLEEIRGTIQAKLPHSPDTIRLARKFHQAKNLIHEAAKSAVRFEKPDQFATETKELYQKLRELYKQEATLLSQTWEAIDHSSSSLRPMIAATSAQVSDAVGKLQDGASAVLHEAQRWRRYLKAYFKGLLGPWAIASGGLAAVGTYLLMGASVPLTVTFGVVGILVGPILPILLKEKLFAPYPNATDKETVLADGGHAPTTCSLDNLVRTNVVKALELELQSNSQETIAMTVKSIENDCFPNRIGTVEQTQQLLDQVQQRLKQLPKPSL